MKVTVAAAAAAGAAGAAYSRLCGWHMGQQPLDLWHLTLLLLQVLSTLGCVAAKRVLMLQ
jgi:hypothetical protein